jgi:uncharacterized protein YbjT (DUF2867 family)
MILLTGATGTIGRALVPELRALNIEARAMTREPERAESRLGKDVDIVNGDFADPSSLAKALDGVDTLFLLTAPGPTVAMHDTAMLAAVKTSRVEKIVKLSAFGVEVDPPLKSSAWHRPGERAVIDSGLAWTLLRPAGFASNALGWAPVIRAGGAIQVTTGHGKHAFIDPRDVAAVAARALTSPDHDGQAYTLTGPASIDTDEQVAILARALGRSIETAHVTPVIAGEGMRAAGMPDVFVDAVVEGLTHVREGRAAARTDSVEKVLGRAPRSFEDWARDHLSSFR